MNLGATSLTLNQLTRTAIDLSFGGVNVIILSNFACGQPPEPPKERLVRSQNAAFALLEDPVFRDLSVLLLNDGRYEANAAVTEFLAELEATCGAKR